MFLMEAVPTSALGPDNSFKVTPDGAPRLDRRHQ
jgi:hypothetical protein